MHDKNGNELKVGDTVLVPMVVRNLQPNEGYFNCHLESVHGRRPDGAKEAVYSINTGVVVLLNHRGD